MLERFRMAALVLAVALGVLLPMGVDAQLRQSVERPYLAEIGEPTLISRDLLAREMRRISEMRDYIDLYGWPDYAEVQEVRVEPPLAPYEVRLYYVHRDIFLAYTPVNISPAMRDFGIRTYVGRVPTGALARILTPRSEPLPLLSTEPAEMEPPFESGGAEGSSPDLDLAIERLEAAADRAAFAAEIAERASLAATDSADRAVDAVDAVERERSAGLY